jgi:hypothetical protein
MDQRVRIAIAWLGVVAGCGSSGGGRARGMVDAAEPVDEAVGPDGTAAEADGPRDTRAGDDAATGADGGLSPDTGSERRDAAPDGGRDGGERDAVAPADVGGTLDAGRADREGPAGTEEGLICTADHWCWENPLPQGNQLQALWPVADDELWAAGAYGTILRWKGGTWSSTNTIDASVTIEALWGSAASDVWAVGWREIGVFPGESVILHWDGARWSPAAHPKIDRVHAVFGTGPADVLALPDDSSHFLRWDGASWKQIYPSPGAFTGLWAAGPGDYWAVGLNGRIHHWDGQAWLGVDSPVFTNLRAVWGAGSKDVWAVGDVGVILHYDGVKWTQAANHIVPGNLHAVWGSGPRDVWAVGNDGVLDTKGTVVHFDGDAWSVASAPAGTGLFAVRGRRAGLAWAVGRAGRILRWDGGAWSSLSRGTTAPIMYTITGSGPRDVWIGGQTLLHWDGTGFTETTQGSEGSGHLFSLGRDDVWAASIQAVRHFDGNGWSSPPFPSADYPTFVWGAARDDVWAAGGVAGLFHYDGRAWAPKTVGTGETIVQLGGNDGRDVWAVGDRMPSGLYHFDGAAWTMFDSGLSRRVAWVSGAGRGEAWAVGEQGGSAFFSGGRWTPVPTGTGQDLSQVFVVDPGDSWAAGSLGTILHHDGSAWKASASGTGLFLGGIWASGPSDLWAVGYDGAILHKRR